jgi:hypothetical protein
MSHPPNNNMNDSESMHFQMAQNHQQQPYAAAASAAAPSAGAPNTVKLSKIIACEIKVCVVAVDLLGAADAIFGCAEPQGAVNAFLIAVHTTELGNNALCKTTGHHERLQCHGSQRSQLEASGGQACQHLWSG